MGTAAVHKSTVEGFAGQDILTQHSDCLAGTVNSTGNPTEAAQWQKELPQAINQISLAGHVKTSFPTLTVLQAR